MSLDMPLPGEKAPSQIAPPSKAEIEAEGQQFMAAMHQLTGGF